MLKKRRVSRDDNDDDAARACPLAHMRMCVSVPALAPQELSCGVVHLPVIRDAPS
jgi:hypothetical protein